MNTVEKGKMNKLKVIVNFSGGKDSTVAILEALKRYPKEEILLCWQDTGAEYLETKAHIEKVAGMLELPLVILKPPEDFWRLSRRRGYFPTQQFRQCTLYLKQQLFRTWVRHNRDQLGDEIVVVSGIRADESISRFGFDPWCLLPGLTLKSGKFTAHGWLPCFQMTAKETRERVKAEGLPLHPCYEFSARCSCWCCIFQPNHVVKEYAEQHWGLYEKACLLEDEIQHKWKHRFGFNDLMKQGTLFEIQQ